MRIDRHFTTAGQDPYDGVRFASRDSRIVNPDGSAVFEAADVTMPADWSQVAVDIMAQKYFRKTGVTTDLAPVEEDGVPEWLWRSVPASAEAGDEDAFSGEMDARQVFHRLAGTWAYWGWKHGYFDGEDDARAFYDELAFMMATQRAAPNSPQWFNTGLHWAYGIAGPAQGHSFVDPDTGTLSRSTSAYERPQPHACFIQSVADDLVGDGGIMDLWTREARIFKYGSGTGSNFSDIRGENEPLSGGGKSSGLMSFLKIGDRAAGAIKSGGTTRRAAKMVIVDADHPDVEQFIDWKAAEEQKVAALVAGSKTIRKRLRAVVEASAEGLDPADNRRLRRAVSRARRDAVPEGYVQRVLQLLEQDAEVIDFTEFDTDWQGEAYQTVSGQNANNSVRVTADFLDAVREDREWNLVRRTDGEVAKTLPARALWDRIALAAWQSADPGVQYDTTINEWHTAPAGGRIRGSNPCVTADTLVATEDGLQRIDSLVGQQPRVVGLDGELHRTARVIETGVKPVYRLRTQSGYELRLTSDHRVWTIEHGDVAASELEPGDTVQLLGAPFGRETLETATAEYVGLMLGDGSIGRDGAASLTLAPNDGERAIAARMAEVVNRFPRERGMDTVHVTERDSTVAVVTNARAVRETLRRYAVLDERSHGKRLTDAALRLDRPSLAAVLRGLFTADGTVANYRDKSHYVALDSTSLDLLRQVQQSLLGFGIKSKLYRDRRVPGVSLLPDGRGGMAEYPVRSMHSLRISRTSRLVFEREIGFMPESDKAERLRDLNQERGTYQDRMTDPVASIEYTGDETVYDLTEPVTDHFVAGGIAVHNCSEYMFLDDTACNLASLNLLRFYDEETRTFDTEAYTHASRLWTVVLEISVLMAQYPSPAIAQLSHDYRTLGLGYANLGALLMVQGIPYDSPEALAQTSAYTALLTGVSYATSAEMAGELGAFPEYDANREAMLRVIRNHRRAAHDAPEGAYEGLTVLPRGLDAANCPEPLVEAAREAWDDALSLGEAHGYRNAQTTLIAPTGTIGLLMDCDTTGVEPDFALVKFKKLAGGGYFRIINESVPSALRALGYGPREVDDIVGYCAGTGGLEGAPHINRHTLAEMGFTRRVLDTIDGSLVSAFDITFAFNRWVLGDDFCRETLGLTDEQLADPSLSILEALGFTRAQIEEANDFITGRMTIEGAPHLREEHYAVFDCANRCGRYGTRYIEPMAHVRAMAAAQPFLSGAISKTINMPDTATVQEVAAVYDAGADMMLKALALYRDGSKLSQPLAATVFDEWAEEDEDFDDLDGAPAEAAPLTPEMAVEEAERILRALPTRDAREVVRRAVGLLRGERVSLPSRRNGFAQKARVGGHTIYLHTGEFEDGSLGELFISMSKDGAAFRSLMNCFAIAVSIGLQHGVPLEAYVDSFLFTKFEPNGMVTGNDRIHMATSIIDYVFRELAITYLGRDDVAHMGQVDLSSTSTAEDEAAPYADAPASNGATGAVEVTPAALPAPNPANFVVPIAGGSDAADTPVADPPAPAPSAPAPESRTDAPSAAAAAPSSAQPTTATSTVPLQMSDTAQRTLQAKQMGFEGDPCPECGQMMMVRNGTCLKCVSCGATSGCS